MLSWRLGRSSGSAISKKHRRFLLGSGVVLGSSRDQPGDERAEQGFAASACVVHELEEDEVKRQLVLRDTPMRAWPGAQQKQNTVSTGGRNISLS